MAITTVKIDGHAEIGINDFIFVCAFCGNHDKTGATVEFNFRDQKVFYLCSKCNKMNEIFFGSKPAPPLPKTRLGR